MRISRKDGVGIPRLFAAVLLALLAAVTVAPGVWAGEETAGEETAGEEMAGEEMAEHEGAPAVTAAVVRDLEGVEKKLVGLAEAIPAEKYGWTPAEGVRTVSQVFMHVAGANFFLPTLLGVEWPEGVDRELEKVTEKAEVVATLKESFAHAKEAVGGLGREDLHKEVTLGPNTSDGLGAILILSGHGHEHLGQAIAYARSIDVAPPWSGGGS